MNTLPGDPTLPPGVTMNDIDPPREPEEMSDTEASEMLWSALDRLVKACSKEIKPMTQNLRDAVENARHALQETEQMTDAQRCDLLHGALYALALYSDAMRSVIQGDKRLEGISETHVMQGWMELILRAQIVLEETKL